MLKIQNLTLQRGGSTILGDINFTVDTGTIYAIVGPNGAGKSTLAYSLMGCDGYQLNGGSIILDGQDITHLNISQRARLGITLAWQEPAHFEGISVEDYLFIGMKEKNLQDAEEALHRVMLAPDQYLKRKVDKNLSGGERKRIELASVFTMKPRLAILDEPDSGIDILALESIIEFIRTLKERGSTVLIITHRVDVAKAAQRAALIDKGCLVNEGTASEVIAFFENKCLLSPKFL
ncbi:MAG TPA: ABC transporter ATP-binding protein [Thermodesulfovibrionia bacterium]|nr:ABC transporter ATP-binding protein [Thermodesulfovibrionia bacterium]